MGGGAGAVETAQGGAGRVTGRVGGSADTHDNGGCEADDAPRCASFNDRVDSGVGRRIHGLCQSGLGRSWCKILGANVAGARSVGSPAEYHSRKPGKGSLPALGE